MIKLITDGALPHPAKCVACGYGGNERFYFWFKYKEKWGQVLICTTCMSEAASMPETDFVSMDSHNALLDELIDLRKKNERLAELLSSFRSSFDSIVDSLVAGIDHANDPIVEEVRVAEPELLEEPTGNAKLLLEIVSGDIPALDEGDTGYDGPAFDPAKYEPDIESVASVSDNPFGKF